ncbi:MAG: SPFH/Band 7/PHB domain protein, partial [Candidatus ainarchaeum sp.]|nr:SPFH/Band 7/PHB domain protein [Candidatus ainarchaeum sp.]
MWEIFLVIIVAIAIILFLLSIKIVRPTQRGLVERLGKYHHYAGQGIHFLIPFIDAIVRVNITEQMVDAQQQEVITKDNLNAKVDAQIYFKVQDIEEGVKRSQYKVNNYQVQIVALARTTLRNIIGQLSFEEVNSMRDKLNQELAKALDKETATWGISVVRSELKEIQPPQDVLETMNKVLIAKNSKTAAIDFATAKETEADGFKRAAIRQAEGQKTAEILTAEGQAKAIELVNKAADAYFKGNAVDLKKLETAQAMLKDNSRI